MKINKLFKAWMIATFLALYIAGCATTQEEIIEEDGPPPEDQTQVDTGVVTDDSTTGADVTGLDDSDASGATPIVDDTPKTALEMLEATEGALSNRTIYFEFDSAKLSDESLAILEEHGNFIAANGDVSVRLEGHADERGSREYNIGLGERRAQAVRQILMLQGVSTAQLSTVSYGEERPAAFGSDEQSYSQNRRVELVYR